MTHARLTWQLDPSSQTAWVSPCGTAEKRRSPRRVRSTHQLLTRAALSELSVAKRVRRGLGLRASQGTWSEAEGGRAGAASLPTFLGVQVHEVRRSQSRSPAGAKSPLGLRRSPALAPNHDRAGSSPRRATPFLCVDKERKQRKRPWCLRPPLRCGFPAMLTPCSRAELASLRSAQTGGASQMSRRATRASQGAVLLGEGTREHQYRAAAQRSITRRST